MMTLESLRPHAMTSRSTCASAVLGVWACEQIMRDAGETRCSRIPMWSAGVVVDVDWWCY